MSVWLLAGGLDSIWRRSALESRVSWQWLGEGSGCPNVPAGTGETRMQRPKVSGRFLFQQSGVARADYNGPELFTGTKLHLRNGLIPERDVLPDCSFVGAIWQLLGKKILQERMTVVTNLALLHAVDVGAALRPEQIVDDRPAERPARRVPLPETTLPREECDFQPEATLGAFPSSLR